MTDVIMLERAGVTLVGEHVRHIAVGRVATAEISAVGFQREDIDINILSPSKVPVLYRWVWSCLVQPSEPTQPHDTCWVTSYSFAIFISIIITDIIPLVLPFYPQKKILKRVKLKFVSPTTDVQKFFS